MSPSSYIACTNESTVLHQNIKPLRDHLVSFWSVWQARTELVSGLDHNHRHLEKSILSRRHDRIIYLNICHSQR